ncbi:MAG: xylulokinase [Rhodobacteraceae bacterium]|nr:xylulokinase [Paracoccaceae bacterium]
MTGAYLGIDIGTSGCKSLMLSTDGVVLGAETATYDFQQPQSGWSEQDPAIWRKGVRKTVRTLISTTDAEVRCIGLSGQMHGMTALDASHRIIRPAILWNDQRNEAQCEQITGMCGGLGGLIQLVGNRMLPGFTGGKILWYQQNEPDLYERTRYILNPKDYLRLVLTGEIATEGSDASGTGLFDVRKQQWCRPLIKRIGLEHHHLAPVCSSLDVTGYTTASAADEFGIAPGVPVIGGGGDAVIQTLGSGVRQPGSLQTTIGTAGIVATLLDRPLENSLGRVQLSCNVLPETWHCMGVSLNAGSALKWWKDIQSGQETGVASYDDLESIATGVAPGSEGLIFLPYLMGERCPWPDPHISAAFVGVRSHHDHTHFYRAVFEGIILSLRDIATQVCPGSQWDTGAIVSSGGGSSSRFWNQMLADMFGARTTVVESASHGAAFGAALLAGIHDGAWSDRAIDTVCRVKAEWQPDTDLKSRYDELFDIYRTLYDALKQASHRLSGVLPEEISR